MITQEAIDKIELELGELNDRLNRLHEFLHSDKAEAISDEQRYLLFKQESFMEAYADILKQRIKVAYEDFHVVYSDPINCDTRTN